MKSTFNFLSSIGFPSCLSLLIIALWFSTADAVGNDRFRDTLMRPWESRPYQVRVWICNDQSPALAATLPRIGEEIMRRSELADPCAWNVTVETAPADWAGRLLGSIDATSEISGLSVDERLADQDKLIAVCLTAQDGAIRYRVREFDVQTEQWGAMLDRICPQSNNLPASLFEAILSVFMPIARIDRVSETGEVFVRARAINACVQSDMIDGTVTPIENSPVWVRPEDRFLPIIRRVDRNGDLMQLEPIPFTFLTVDSQTGSRLVCKIHSRQRVPLGGRSSKRAKKLALVIRPPESSTQLKLISRKEKQPLAGYEIFSRRPGAPREEESEFVGLTDWRGVIEVPAFEEGLRLIYVKRGSRPLMKLPIIPGLYDEVETTVPDDEARLNAEGIARGFQIEILNLVAQRELYQSLIKSAVEDKNGPQAESLLQQFQRLESPQNLKVRLANQESQMKSSTLNPREVGQIGGMFQQLRALVNSNLRNSLESDLQAMVQQIRSKTQ